MAQYQELIAAALDDLNKAQKAMRQQTAPKTPLPRPRIFIVAPGWEWPRGDDYEVFRVNKNSYECITWSDVENRIINACGNQPRQILRALRRIQAATAWCEARAEGRQRQAEEILRQQQKAVEALEAEAAMLALK